MQSEAGKLLCSKTALKRCTSTEHLWKRKLVWWRHKIIIIIIIIIIIMSDSWFGLVVSSCQVIC